MTEGIINVCKIKTGRNLGDVEMSKQGNKFIFNIYIFLNDTTFSPVFLRKTLIPLTKTISKVKLNSDNKDVRNIVKEYFKLEN